MPTIRFKPEFEQELLKRKIKCKFLHNLKHTTQPHLKGLSMKDKVNIINRRATWSDVIYYSFIWADTPEKLRFWVSHTE